MNNEPVAWMRPDTLECGHGGNVDWEDTGCVPLYTHPVKEITDEEIEQIASQYLTAHAQFIGAGECHYEGEIEFARAILRKAQEK